MNDQGKSTAAGDHLAKTLDAIGIALAEIDLEGRVTAWSAAGERLLGYATADIVGQAYDVLLPPERSGEIRKALDKLRHGRTVPPAETQRRHLDGHDLEVIFTIHPRLARDGKPEGATTTLRDISGSKEIERRLRQSTNELDAILKTVLDGIITINEKGIVEAFNPAAERIFGYRAHEAIGHNVSLLMPEPTRSEHDGYLQRYLDTGVARVIGIGREVTGQRRDGTALPLELAVAPMQFGERRAFVGVLHDISERKRADLELRGLNQALRDNVQELRETLDRLQKTQEQLVQSEKMASLGALVAGVAHEINTPVGICVTAASFLQDSTKEATDAATSGTLTQQGFNSFLRAVNEAVTLLVSNTRRAADLIRSFKQVAVDRSSDQSRQFDLETYLGELLQSLRPALRRHQVQVTVPSDIVLQSLPGALSQVITNLLVNATQHAFPADQAGLVTLQARRDGEYVSIEVTDNGVGIAPENLKRIFDPFFTTARGSGGTGLGLHIAYNLVTQVLGGTIVATSELGRGSCFTLHFPLVAPSNPTHA